LADCTHSSLHPKQPLAGRRTIRLRSITTESEMESTHTREPWNKGKVIGPNPPLKPKDISAIRIRLHNAHQFRALAMFNLAIDSKLRGCDLVNLRVRDIAHGGASFDASDGRAAKNPKFGSARADRTDEGRRQRVDRAGEIDAGAISVSEPALRFTSCLHATVWPHRCSSKASCGRFQARA
jgi:hypothetical protein